MSEINWSEAYPGPFKRGQVNGAIAAATCGFEVTGIRDTAELEKALRTSLTIAIRANLEREEAGEDYGYADSGAACAYGMGNLEGIMQFCVQPLEEVTV
jgi:hypothetical protein